MTDIAPEVPAAPAAATAPATAPEPPADNPAALLAEAMNKSGLLWIDIPGDRAWPAWYAWTGETAYVLNGDGEQHLPTSLPATVDLITKSKDTGGRLLRVRAQVEVLTAASAEYDAAVQALAAKRLNSRPDAEREWRESCTITALRPEATPIEGPGAYSSDPGLREAPKNDATTTKDWKPFHIKGRANSIRARRQRRQRGQA